MLDNSSEHGALLSLGNMKFPPGHPEYPSGMDIGGFLNDTDGTEIYVAPQVDVSGLSMDRRYVKQPHPDVDPQPANESASVSDTDPQDLESGQSGTSLRSPVLASIIIG